MSEAAPRAATGETTLGEVVRRWGDDYETGVMLASPGYQARRRDGTGEPLTAGTPGGLWDLIAAGHAASCGGER